MKNTDIKNQYNKFHDVYSDNIDYDKPSNDMYYNELLSLPITSKTILDIGCGDGSDINKLYKLGAIPVGIEPSIEFVNYAKTKNPNCTIIHGVGERLPFDDNSFDIVVSKWAIQTSPNVEQILAEASRVLKPGGYLVYLSKHPMQQYFGKMREHGNGVNYYDQMVSTLNIYDGKIVLKEPTHTFNEYLNKNFMSKFNIVSFTEESDFPASERFNGGTYPTFFIIKAQKK